VTLYLSLVFPSLVSCVVLVMSAPVVPLSVLPSPNPRQGCSMTTYRPTDSPTELGVAPITVERWAALKEGPPVTKIGRHALYRRSSVQPWLARQEQKHAVA
jgi:hypothetical protein